MIDPNFALAIRQMYQLHALMETGGDEGTGETEADRLRDEMDAPWHAMTDEQRAYYGELSAWLYTSPAIPDIRVDSGDKKAPFAFSRKSVPLEAQPRAAPVNFQFPILPAPWLGLFVVGRDKNVEVAFPCNLLDEKAIDQAVGLTGSMAALNAGSATGNVCPSRICPSASDAGTVGGGGITTGGGRADEGRT